MRYLLTTNRVKLVGANLKFDLVWILCKWGITCTNFTFDTLLVGSLLDENRSNSLNAHAKEYTAIGGYDDIFNATFDKGSMEKISQEDLRVYAGGDTDAAYRVKKVICRELVAKPSLARLYVTILHPASRVFEKVERSGMCVDQVKYAELRSDLVSELARLERAAVS